LFSESGPPPRFRNLSLGSSQHLTSCHKSILPQSAQVPRVPTFPDNRLSVFRRDSSPSLGPPGEERTHPPHTTPVPSLFFSPFLFFWSPSPQKSRYRSSPLFQSLFFVSTFFFIPVSLGQAEFPFCRNVFSFVGCLFSKSSRCSLDQSPARSLCFLVFDHVP